MLHTCICILALAALATGQAPTVTIEEGIANNGYTNSQRITFNATGQKAGFPNISCNLDAKGPSTCQYPQMYTNLADGQHTLVVQFALENGQVDTSAQTTFIWTVDTIPPPQPQIAVKPGMQTNAVFPQFQFTVAGVQSGGLSFQCQLSPPRSRPIPFSCFQTTVVASSASPVSGVPGTGLLEGPYTLQVNAIDAAGNHGTAQTYAFTVDLESPKVVLDSTTPNTPNGQTTNSPSMTFAFHSIDMFPERTNALGDYRIITRNPCPLYNCTMRCSLDGAALSPCTSPVTYSGLALPGESKRRTFRVVATDNATNVGSGSDELNYAWNIDRIPPLAILAQTPPKANAVDTATFAWVTNEPSVTPPQFFCSLDNGPQFNCTSIPIGGIYTWVLQNLTHSFNHRFAVVTVDYYGNVAPAISYAWQVDLHPPLVTFNPATWATQGVRLGNPIVLKNGSYTNIVFINFAFSTEPGSLTECQTDNNPWVSCTSPYTVSRLADGSHMFRVRATDLVGHKTYVADQPYWTWITDVTPPRVIIAPQDQVQPDVFSSDFRWSQYDYATFQFQASEVVTYSCSVTPNVSWVNPISCSAPSVRIDNIDQFGDYTFSVRATDQVGNSDPVTSVHSFMWTAAPDAPTTSIVSGPQYYINRLKKLTFSIETPVPRVRIECAVDWLNGNKTVRFAGAWLPCVNRSDTTMRPASVNYTADLNNMLNGTFLNKLDGFYNFKARIVDVFNRVSNTAAYEFVVGCETIPKIQHGTVTYPAGRALGSTASFSCDPFYVPTISSTTCLNQIDGAHWKSIATCHAPAAFAENFAGTVTVSVSEGARYSGSEALCNVTGDPKPEIKLYFKGQLVRTQAGGGTTEVGDLQHNVMDMLPNTLSRRDLGDYRCVANNSFGEASRTVNLNVLFPPSLSTNNSTDSVSADVNGQVTLSCAFSGFRLHGVTWYDPMMRNLSNVSTYQIETHIGLASTNSTLSFTVTSGQHAGIYRCEGFNSLGSASDSFKVTRFSSPQEQLSASRTVTIISVGVSLIAIGIAVGLAIHRQRAALGFSLTAKESNQSMQSARGEELGDTGRLGLLAQVWYANTSSSVPEPAHAPHTDTVDMMGKVNPDADKALDPACQQAAEETEMNSPVYGRLGNTDRYINLSPKGSPQVNMKIYENGSPQVNMKIYENGSPEKSKQQE